MSLKQTLVSGIRLAATVGCILVAVWAVRRWVVESYRVSTGAMETALHEGDYILVGKQPDLFEPRQHAVVLFRSPLLRDTVANPLFLSRCIGMPGDTVRITSEGYAINGRAFPRSPRALNTYFVALSFRDAFLKQLERLRIPARDVKNEAFGITLSLTSFEEYQLRESFSEALNKRFVCRQVPPYELVIPQRGRAYRLNETNLTACREAILRETGGTAVFRDGKLWLEGKETTFFFFKQDYYWLLSDNTNDAVDSRHLGLVPADHLVGTAFFCWYSGDARRILKKVF